MEQIKVLHI